MNRSSILALAALLACAPVLAQKLTNVRVSERAGGPQKTTFKPDTPKVFVTATQEAIPAGRKLRCDWIAVKTDVAPPNYRIDSWEGRSAADSKELTCSFSKPTSGWPVGDYRVDLSIDGKDAGKATFRVAK